MSQNDTKTKKRKLYGFVDETDTFVIRSEGDPDADFTMPWAPGSHWTFRKYKLQSDEEAIQDLAMKMDFVENTDADQMNRAQRRASRKSRLKPKFENRMSMARAMISHMTVEWGGPAFVVPRTRGDGSPNADPYAGTQAPPTPDYISRRDPEELADVEEILSTVYEGMDPDEEEVFQPTTAHLSPPQEKGVHRSGEGAATGDPAGLRLS